MSSAAGTVHFVGAGPGAPDLITVRGARLLSGADLVIWAGSLVNPDLLDLCPPACECLDSSRMTLEEVFRAMRDAASRGLEVVRLHTGDPSIFGAIREQMVLLDSAGIPYDVTPGVSSMSGAAAALRCEYTLPGVTQTLVVTREAGRTPTSAGESLAELASHRTSMAIFLSAGLASQVQADLLAAGRDSDEPVAIVYKATWPDQRVVRCTVGTLAAVAEDAGIDRLALILVGRATAPAGAYDRSRLYDPGFATGYRQAR